jgi:hemoglobin/transferrin/lactoferrin receptor protein
MHRVLFLFVTALTASHAEDRIEGRVADPSGAAISGAQITLQTAAGGVAATAESDREGRFSLKELARGTYELRVVAAGFGVLRQSVRVPSENLELQAPLAGEHARITVTATRGSVDRPADADAVVDVRDPQAFHRPLPTLGHALSESPGILLQQTATSQVSPFLRGLTGYQVLNLIDGIRFNNSTFRSGPNQYLAFIDSSQAQRIESSLGPSSSQYGSDSLGGTIQVLTRETRFGSQPGLDVHGDGALQASSADLSTGATAQVLLGEQRWSWLVGGAIRKHNDLRAGGGDDSRHALRRFFGMNDDGIRGLLGSSLADTGFSQHSVHSKFATRLTDSQLLSLWYQHSGQNNARNYKDLWGGLGRLRSDLTPQALDFAYARYEKLRLGWIDSLSGTFSFNSQSDGTVRQNLRAVDRITTDDGVVRVYGYSAQATTHLGSRQALVFGGELYNEQIYSTRLDRDPVSGMATRSRPLYPDDSRYRTGGLFVQDRVELINGKLRATAGARWTRVRYATKADPTVGVAESAQNFGDVTANASLSAQLTESFGLHVLLGRGFRAPNANDLGAIGINDLGYEIPSSDAVQAGALLGASSGEGALSLGRNLETLKAEHLWNYEFGARFRSRKLEARAQFFDSRLRDPIVRRTLLFPASAAPSSLAGLPVTVIAPTAAQRAQGVVTVATAIDPRAVKAFVNDGSSTYYGTESWLRYAASSHWRAEAAYSFIVGRDLNPNRNIRRLPPQQGMVAVSYARTRFWWRTSIVAAGAQTRLSGGDIDDERIGASRSRADIAAFFNGSRIAPYLQQGVFTPTGETLAQIQNRVLPGVPDATRVPLYLSTAGWWTWNLFGGLPIAERWHINGALLNVLDRNYRLHGSGVDGTGINAYVALRFVF